MLLCSNNHAGRDAYLKTVFMLRGAICFSPLGLRQKGIEDSWSLDTTQVCSAALLLDIILHRHMENSFHLLQWETYFEYKCSLKTRSLSSIDSGRQMSRLIQLKSTPEFSRTLQRASAVKLFTAASWTPTCTSARNHENRILSAWILHEKRIFDPM
jgi:hypothetical protein